MSIDVGERAYELYKNGGWRCAESVLLAVTEHAGIESDLIPAMASAFCGGMGRTGNLCGAYSGAALAISLLKGRHESTESIDACYASVQRLHSKFLEKFGSITCQGLLTLDLRNPEDLKEYQRLGISERCHMFACEAARMAVEIASHSD